LNSIVAEILVKVDPKNKLNSGTGKHTLKAWFKRIEAKARNQRQHNKETHYNSMHDDISP
jgi:hypothetical protein